MPHDIDFLWRMLYFASHSDEESHVAPGDIRDNPDLTGYIDGWESAGHVGIVAESRGAPLGAAWLRQLGSHDSDSPVFVDLETPELAVAVEPGHEGRGIGTTTMAELMELAAGRFPAIVLSVRAENPAVRLYERLGFQTVTTITNRIGTSSLKMIRRL